MHAETLTPEFEDARRLAENYHFMPLWRCMPLRGRTARDIFLAMKRVSKHCFLLESAEPGDGNRWTFLGCDPKLEVSVSEGEVRVKGADIRVIKTQNPKIELRRLMANYKAPRVAGAPPFTGGLVGYFAYDFYKYAEPTLDFDGPDEENFRDADLMLFDKVYAIDALEDKLYLIINVPTADFAENYAAAALHIGMMEQLAFGTEPAQLPPLTLREDFQPLFDEKQYCAMVEEAKRHIFEGDIFQAVLSNRLSARAEGSLFQVYEDLRHVNPSPYMFCFSSDALEFVGAAPETLVKLQCGKLFTYPLAGTRPRGRTLEEDAAQEHALRNDPKELAEHNMLVDLGRNDIGRISRFGSVQVERYMEILRFSHVMHIGSVVTGQLSPMLDAFDVLGAVLPAGTLSGAPKIKACEIIHRLEGCKRGVYGGGIGYVSFCGDMDTCIAIRIAYKRGGKLFVRAGAGIVADSVPEKEYRECENKMAAVVQSVKKVAVCAQGEANG